MHVTHDDLRGQNSFEVVTSEPEAKPLGDGEGSLETSSSHFSARAKKEGVLLSVDGKRIGETGPWLQQLLLEVLPLRSKYTGRGKLVGILPLPTSSGILSEAVEVSDLAVVSWLGCVCMSLNSVWGEDVLSDRWPSGAQLHCLRYLKEQVVRFCSIESRIEHFDWGEFMKIKTIDYKGEEVKVARWFSWSNIAPALPKEIGRVALEEVCVLGCKHYVENFEFYLRPESEWRLTKPPRVMVEDQQWGLVCRGLIDAGVCRIMEESQLHHVDGRPLLNGMFGVTKDEFTDSGTEIYRLIMNLIPLNRLCQPLSGDIATLPSWSSMSPFFLQPEESLLVSSEDVKCFFYVMSVPECWHKFLGFNKPIPREALPDDCQNDGGTYYLVSQVLPMGFLNSVSLAQHVHRNLAQFAGERLDETCKSMGAPEAELRKDRTFPTGSSLWRIYLDNYDLLEKVSGVEGLALEGALSPGALALRHEYTAWDVPRNVKKSVQRSTKCEVQGATVDGTLGVAYPRESKMAKYYALGLGLVEKRVVTQKECQVVCGGLVYFSMFRRPLLGCLNNIWQFIEGFNNLGCEHLRPLPSDCRLEVLRFLSLLPLACLDFRLPFHPQVTCSDASSSGGGICASAQTTLLGETISQGKLRGEEPEKRGDFMVLVVGLFDGLGALRLAVEALGVPVIGYISVEKSSEAQRVVESHFPGVQVVDDVTKVDETMVKQWAAAYSQASLVLIGAGPPCQGVSGLNADRRGALKDERSSLFSEVPRIRTLFKTNFAWCPTYSLMESVASMDQQDRLIMSTGYGSLPVFCDAGDCTWCHRPRLYWCDWELREAEGYRLEPYDQEIQRLRLHGTQCINEVDGSRSRQIVPSLHSQPQGQDQHLVGDQRGLPNVALRSCTDGRRISTDSLHINIAKCIV